MMGKRYDGYADAVDKRIWELINADARHFQEHGTGSLVIRTELAAYVQAILDVVDGVEEYSEEPADSEHDSYLVDQLLTRFRDLKNYQPGKWEHPDNQAHADGIKRYRLVEETPNETDSE